MIYVVGDLHGDLSKIKKLHEDKKLSKSDTVILLGDTGLSSLPNNPPPYPANSK